MVIVSPVKEARFGTLDHFHCCVLVFTFNFNCWNSLHKWHIITYVVALLFLFLAVFCLEFSQEGSGPTFIRVNTFFSYPFYYTERLHMQGFVKISQEPKLCHILFKLLSIIAMLCFILYIHLDKITIIWLISFVWLEKKFVLCKMKYILVLVNYGNSCNEFSDLI